MSNVFTRWWERRSTSLAAPSPELLTLFSSGPTESGQTVDATTALKVPAVFSCCQVLAQDIARTPTKLRVKTAPDTYEDATEHPLYDVLNALWNPEQTAYDAKFTMMFQLLTTGRAFAEIVRVDGRIVALWPLDSASMRVDRTPQRVKRWTYHAGGQTIVWLFDASQPPILELRHESPILRCRETIGSALALQAYVAKFFANDARPSAVLQAPAAITETQATAMAARWKAIFASSGTNRRGVAVLDSGVTFNAIASENDAAQLNETMKALSTAICGSFRVPPWKAGLMDATNYSNMESGENSYVTSTLDPFFESWTEAMRRDLLTSRQYGQFTVTFDRHALVRNDVKSLYDSLSRGIQNGFPSQNDARRALGMNPLPDGGDVYMVNSALAPVGAKEPNVA